MNDDHPLDLLLRRWSRYVTLSAQDCEDVLALPATRKTFERDAYIVREGDLTSHCCILVKGMAFRQKMLRDGGRQIISFHIPGEFVDLQNSMLGTADHNVQSLSYSETLLVPRTALIQLADSRPAVRMAMWIDSLIDASIFREWVINVGRRDSRARTAHLLCELVLQMQSIGLGGEGSYSFPVTQDQLADATGLTAVHINRTLQALRKDGLIELSARSLKVLDWDRLREAGDFNELYLHHKV